MAKRQRRDSQQERAAEKLDVTSTPSKERKAATYSFCVEIPVPNLRVGDFIATKVNERTGQVVARQEVKEIEPMARGCRNLHVNGKDCYDRCSTVRIVKTTKVAPGAVVLPDGSPGTVDELLYQLGITEAPTT